MAKLRVYQLARELNRDNSEIIRELQHMGVPVTSHSNTVEDRLAEQLRKKLGVYVPEEVAKPEPQVEEIKVEAPPVELPKVEAPKVEAPRVEAPKVIADFFRSHSNSSSRKAMIGCPMASEEVIPAKNNSPNQSAPAMGANDPQLLNRVGSVRKPSENPLPPAVACRTASSPR